MEQTIIDATQNEPHSPVSVSNLMTQPCYAYNKEDNAQHMTTCMSSFSYLKKVSKRSFRCRNRDCGVIFPSDYSRKSHEKAHHDPSSIVPTRAPLHETVGITRRSMMKKGIIVPTTPTTQLLEIPPSSLDRGSHVFGHMNSHSSHIDHETDRLLDTFSTETNHKQGHGLDVHLNSKSGWI
eukprot:TRINITY_DN3951_c0_g1_i1.p1 TRINITY_DN3951_c0_g1~~TRINITY_DN3951_c0_g1_i1.p1  ORF type:complete len:180 (+),score=25.93 TRINITY_DN3951_c0_g1_i1:142-681(+)